MDDLSHMTNKQLDQHTTKTQYWIDRMTQTAQRNAEVDTILARHRAVAKSHEQKMATICFFTGIAIGATLVALLSRK